MLVIIIGALSAGKNTLAGYLQSEHGFTIVDLISLVKAALDLQMVELTE